VGRAAMGPLFYASLARVLVLCLPCIHGSCRSMPSRPISLATAIPLSQCVGYLKKSKRGNLWRGTPMAVWYAVSSKNRVEVEERKGSATLGYGVLELAAKNTASVASFVGLANCPGTTEADAAKKFCFPVSSHGVSARGALVQTEMLVKLSLEQNKHEQTAGAIIKFYRDCSASLPLEQEHARTCKLTTLHSKRAEKNKLKLPGLKNTRQNRKDRLRKKKLELIDVEASKTKAYLDTQAACETHKSKQDAFFLLKQNNEAKLTEVAALLATAASAAVRLMRAGRRRKNGSPNQPVPSHAAPRARPPALSSFPMPSSAPLQSRITSYRAAWTRGLSRARP